MMGKPGQTPPPASLSGTIIAAHGRQYRVELAEGEILSCFPRGKKSELACGDEVSIQRSGDGQGVIESIAPRAASCWASRRRKSPACSRSRAAQAAPVASRGREGPSANALSTSASPSRWA